MPDSLNAHLAVMRSAFSTATAACKIPDGRATTSIATREAVCACRVTPGNVSATIFALYPGLGGGLALFNYAQAANGAGPNVVTPADYTIFDPGQNYNVTQSVNRPDKFRCTSLGLRISCVNSAQFNNGWFEAVRVPTDYIFNTIDEVPKATFKKVIPTVDNDGDGDVDVQDANIATAADANPTPVTADWLNSQGTIIPNITLENGVMSSNKWCNHPSYVTGKLADLYKHQFYLQSTGDREFIRQCQHWTGIDTNLDMVLVRVYTTGAAETALHYHAVGHFELVYDATSERCRFHSQCFSAPNLVTKVEASIKKDPKASIIRSPNAYGINPY